MKLNKFLMATALVAATASAANATVDKGWYVGLEAGANWVADNDFSFTTTPGFFNDRAEFDTGWTVLGTLGYAWHNHLRLEIELGYRSNDFDALTVNGVPTAITSSEFDEFSQMLNLIYDIDLGSKWALSLGAGIGGDYVSYKLNGIDDEEYVFAWQLLAEMAYHINNRLDLFVGYRYFNAQDPEFQTLAIIDRYDDVEKHAVTIGLRWDLWAEEARVVTPDPGPGPQPEPGPNPPPKQFIVFFGFNKANLTSEAQRVVAEAAAAAKQFGSATILVTGHTDTVGSNRYNQRLSMRRASNVKSELVRNGIGSGMITTIGKGETELLVQTGDAVKEPQNRRTTIDLN